MTGPGNYPAGAKRNRNRSFGELFDETQSPVPMALQRSRGRKPRWPAILEVVELVEEDLYELEQTLGVNPVPLLNIRHTHHALARYLASGMSNNDAAALSGLSPSRVSILMDDPAFSELLDFYSRKTEEIRVDVITRMKQMNLDALEILQERMLETPEELKTGDLLEIVKTTADRSGAGPKSTQEHRVLMLDAKDLTAVKAEVHHELETDKVLDLCPRDGDGTFVHSEQSETPGNEG